MRQESNHRMNNGERDSVKISNSRAMGVIVLIALLFLFQVVTFVVQRVRMREIPAKEAVAGGDAGASSVGKQAFPFNPNTITQDSLQLLGFSQRQAASIIKYRTKGGKFRVKRDFDKMYVVDSAKYALLEPHILLPDSLPSTKLPRERMSREGKPQVRIPQEGKPIEVPRPDTLPVSKYGTRAPKEKYVCNLNTADSTALVELYGIGGYYARKILRYRERLGGSFVDARQLLEIEGFTQERFDKIVGNIVVLEGDVKRVSLLEADMEFLRRHPYIGPYAAKGIETFLRLKGREKFSSDVQLLDELVKERVLSVQNADKLKEYLLHL